MGLVTGLVLGLELVKVEAKGLETELVLEKPQ